MAAEQSGVGSWMDSCPVLRAEGDVEGRKGHLSVARLTPGTCTYTLIFHAEMESADPNWSLRGMLELFYHFTH